MKRVQNSSQALKIIKKCHFCGFVFESSKEEKKCMKCSKSFLPSNYFQKIHNYENYKFDELFSASDELDEDDLIVGLHVLW